MIVVFMVVLLGWMFGVRWWLFFVILIMGVLVVLFLLVSFLDFLVDIYDFSDYFFLWLVYEFG